jgi:quinoprotein glucose dehydrogenase
MMSVDRERDLIFLPTATAGPNFFGGLRPGDNRYANSVVALRGSTGQVVWHFQTLHHDVWDLDLPAQPILVDIEKDGQSVPAVVQVTKQSLIFILHRETGEPIFPVEERPVPTDGVPGEILSPTQPFPTVQPAIGLTGISPDDAWGLTLWDKAECRDKLTAQRSGDLYTPPSLIGTITPGIGQLNWGGAAFDPASNLLIAPVTKIPRYLRLIPVSEVDPELLKSPMAGMPSGIPGRIEGTDYTASYGPLLSSFGVPCIAPPWGELVAVDLAEAEIKWRVPLGSIEKLAPFSLPLNWGTQVAGGPIITASGLIFIGATADEKFRAFDLDSGEELWKVTTPTASMATPMTYEADGRQFVVVASGGHLWQYSQDVADYVVAYALPKK